MCGCHGDGSRSSRCCQAAQISDDASNTACTACDTTGTCTTTAPLTMSTSCGSHVTLAPSATSLLIRLMPLGVPYTSDMYCPLVVDGVQGRNLTLLSRDLESGNDYLTLYAGATTSSPLLAVSAGSPMDAVVLDTGGVISVPSDSLLLLFTSGSGSDDQPHDLGFVVAVGAVPLPAGAVCGADGE
jgi:hypothetical protein